VIEGIECPADPEILLDVADGGAEAVGGAKERVEAVSRRSADDGSVSLGGRSGEASPVINGRRNSETRYIFRTRLLGMELVPEATLAFGSAIVLF